MLFLDRHDAGRALARVLRNQPGLADGMVLALPRGGVPVAFEIAQELRLPLDVFVVRKLGVPGQEELAMGAVASGGTVVTDPQVVKAFAISPQTIEVAVAREQAEIERREQVYRAGLPALRLENRTVILVDDGVATGSTMKAAILALHTRAARIVVAVPVAAWHSAKQLRSMVDQLVCLDSPLRFYAVGEFYQRFEQTSDEEVRELLTRARQPGPEPA